jgi:hypothetical protein
VLITPDFVYLHLPKTAGTFVTAMVSMAYQRRVARLVPRAVERSVRARARQSPPRAGALCAAVALFGSADYDKHGGRQAVPRKYAERPLVATIRHPFDRYVSKYEFGWWRGDRFAFPDLQQEARKRFHHFPDLSFREFMAWNRTIADARARALGIEVEVGLETIDYLSFFGRDQSDLVGISRTAIRHRLERDLGEIHLLRAERVAASLSEYLRAAGIDQEMCEQVRQEPQILPPKSRSNPRLEHDWTKYFTADMRREYADQDASLFEVFPYYEP